MSRITKTRLGVGIEVPAPGTKNRPPQIAQEPDLTSPTTHSAGEYELHIDFAAERHAMAVTKFWIVLIGTLAALFVVALIVVGMRP
jgi:hypothetical protein